MTRSARLLGHVRGKTSGPMLLVVGGIHGNEPAGVHAARRVVRRLKENGLPLRGDFVALAGNRKALDRGVRFLEEDLNRSWTDTHLAALREADATTLCDEDEERVELLEALDTSVQQARGDVCFLDLHTTSAAGVPFLAVGEDRHHLEFAFHLPAPILLGLQNRMNGTLLEYMCRHARISIGIEGGQHDAKNSVDHLETLLWSTIVAAGLLDRESLPELERARAALEQLRSPLPDILKVQHRHVIAPEDRFEMEPGFANVHRVRAQELLGRDRTGEIRAPRDAFLFLPLYQALGDDGFFLGRPESAFWLKLRARVRRLLRQNGRLH